MSTRLYIFRRYLTVSTQTRRPIYIYIYILLPPFILPLHPLSSPFVPSTPISSRITFLFSQFYFISLFFLFLPAHSPIHTSPHIHGGVFSFLSSHASLPFHHPLPPPPPFSEYAPPLFFFPRHVLVIPPNVPRMFFPFIEFSSVKSRFRPPSFTPSILKEDALYYSFDISTRVLSSSLPKEYLYEARLSLSLHQVFTFTLGFSPILSK